MKVTFMVGIATFTILAVCLLFRRYGLENNRRRLERLQEEVDARGLPGDGE